MAKNIHKLPGILGEDEIIASVSYPHLHEESYEGK